MEKRNVFLLTNQKGGIGKTTTNINTSCALGLEFKKKVLAIDMDGQANLTTGFGFNPNDYEGHSFYDLVMNEKQNPRDFILKSNFDNVDIIPSCRETNALDADLMQKNLREFKLTKILSKIKQNYDFILLDMAPNLGITTLNGLIAANYIIILISSAEFSIDAVSEMLNTVYDIQEDDDLNKNNLEILGACWVNKDLREKKLNREVQGMLDKFNYFKKYFTEIHYSSAIKYAQLAHEPINVFDKKNKTSDQFKKLAKELIHYA